MKAQAQQLSNALHAEMNPEFFSGICKLIHELRICLPDFHNRMDDEYLNYIYENVSEKRCDLLIHSKLSKYQVDRFIKSKINPSRVNNPESKYNTGTLFHSFLESLGDVCSKLEDSTIYYSGNKHFVTFKSVFENSGLGNSGYTAKAAKESLVNSGCIEIIDKNRIRFLTKIPMPINSEIDAIRQISNTILRYISTQFQNISAHQDDSMILMEKSMMSNIVPTENHESCFQELRNHFEPPHYEGKDILEKYEVKNSKSTHNIGYQTFFFKTKS